MNTQEQALWNRYHGAKSIQMKIKVLDELKAEGGLASLDKLCEEFLSQKSPAFRNEAMKLIQYLELKVQPAGNALPNYHRLLEKYGLSNLQHFFFKDHLRISKGELDEHIRQFVQKNSGSGKKQAFQCQFPVTPRLSGIVQLSVDPRGRDQVLHNLTYGFLSNYRDFGGGYINTYPFDQCHHQALVKEGEAFELFGQLGDRMDAYYSFLGQLEEGLLSVHVAHPLEADFYQEFCRYLSFKKELWFLLSLINVQVSHGAKDRALRTARTALAFLDPGKAGSGWRDYFEEKVRVLSSSG